jgi:hypothetical protein
VRPLIKSYVGAVAIAPYLIVKAAAAAIDTTVRAAAAATDALIGITGSMGGDAGDAVDVTILGPAEVRLGGTVAFGDPLTSDANGKAIKAVGTAATTKFIVAYALAPGVADDVIPVRVAPGILALA